MNIVDYIPVGRENAISRKMLSQATGLSDRIVRGMIEDARIAGEIICNLQDGRGYYVPRPDDLESVARQYWQNRHRAISVLVQNKNLRRRLRQAGRPV